MNRVILGRGLIRRAMGACSLSSMILTAIIMLCGAEADAAGNPMRPLGYRQGSEVYSTAAQACNAYVRSFDDGKPGGAPEYVGQGDIRCFVKRGEDTDSQVTAYVACPAESSATSINACVCDGSLIPVNGKCTDPAALPGADRGPMASAAGTADPRIPPPAERGMLEVDDILFQGIATNRKLIILVRDSNSAAVRFIGRAGYAPKPEVLKAKTRKANPSAPSDEDVGLAAADKNDKKLIESLANASPRLTYDQYMAKLKAQGFAVGPAPKYIITQVKTRLKFYSDYDLHGVYDVRGERAFQSSNFRQVIKERTKHEMVQHGPHDDWTERNNPDFAGPNAGPQPPMTAYLPDGTMAWIDSIPKMRDFYRRNNIPWPYHPRFGS